MRNFAAKFQELNIGLYISELLQDHDYVIIPGVGAFFSHYRPSVVDEEKGIVHPPARDLTFSPELRNNDGLLLNHLAHREGITAPVAHGLLENLKDELHYRLDHGETITLEHLGTLARQEGSFRFFAGAGLEVLPDTFGMKSVQLKKAAGNLVEQDKPVKACNTTSSEASVRKKAGRKKHLLWLLILPIAGMVVFALSGIWKGDTGSSGTKEENQVQANIPVPLVQPADSVRSDSVQVSPETLVPEVIHPVRGLYYVIGGSFKDRENADKYSLEAVSKGYEPLYLGEIGNFHVVAIGQYTTEREAVIHRNRIFRQDSTTGVWVYYVRHKEE